MMPVEREPVRRTRTVDGAQNDAGSRGSSADAVANRTAAPNPKHEYSDASGWLRGAMRTPVHVVLAIGALAFVAGGCGDDRTSASPSELSLPAPWCSPGGGIGPPNRSLTAEEENMAKTRLQADRLIMGLVPAWQVVEIGPYSASCPGEPERLVGAAIRVQFGEPADVSWDEDAIACVNGEAQPTRFELNWSGIRGAAALVPLPTGNIRWTPVPPSPGESQGQVTRTTKSTLGARGGECPKRTSTD